MIAMQQAVAAIVLEHPECAAVFQRKRIDYFCHGDRSLEAAARERGLDAACVEAELSRAIAEPIASSFDPRRLTTEALVAHIVATHHAYARHVLPCVHELALMVTRTHGPYDPRLHELLLMVDDLAFTLLAHLDVEERDLFPALTVSLPDAARLERELAAMADEHLVLGDVLDAIRDVTEDFRLPDWAGDPYRTLFSKLEQLERDTQMHVLLENHVLKARLEHELLERAHAGR